MTELIIIYISEDKTNFIISTNVASFIVFSLNPIK